MKNSLIWQHALSISYYCRHLQKDRQRPRNCKRGLIREPSPLRGGHFSFHSYLAEKCLISIQMAFFISSLTEDPKMIFDIWHFHISDLRKESKKQLQKKSLDNCNCFCSARHVSDAVVLYSKLSALL